MNFKAVIEGLLFLVGDDGLKLDTISQIIEKDNDDTIKYIEELSNKYNNDDSGIEIKKLGDLYKLTTKKEYKKYYEKLVESNEVNTLSQSCLETLAIIAYNEPITRVEIDELRGVNSSHIVRKLVAKGLIKDVGKSTLPGKPMLYKTTDEFLDCFGLSSIEELPKLDIVSEEEKNDLDLFKTNKVVEEEIEIIE